MTAPAQSSWRQWHGYAPLDASLLVRASAAAGDVAEGVRRWRLWTFLALDDIKNSYRRTVIGPWWLTLQNVFYIAGLAFLFSAVFDRPLREFLPYVGVGYIVFALASGLTRLGGDVFVNAAGTIGSNRQPLSVLVFRGAAVEVLDFAHSAVIIVALGVAGLLSLGPASLFALPGLLLVVVNGVASAFWLGPLVARFRDVGPLITSVLRMLAFFTPIFWQVDTLQGQERAALLAWNPFYYLLESVRAPLLGTPVRTVLIGAVLITAVNSALGAAAFLWSRSRLPYWVA